MENIEVVAKVSELTESDFIKDVKKKSNAQTEYPDIVEELSPSAATVSGKIEDMETKISERDSLLLEAKTKTSEINAIRKEVTGYMTKKWAPQIQEAVTSKSQVSLLGFYVKGDNPSDPPSPEVAPLVTKIETNVPGRHTLHFVDSVLLKKALPPSILRIDVYGQTGGTQPADLPQLIANGGGYLGEADKAKYVNTFANSTNKGKTEFYIAVYISKKTKKPFSYSIVYSAVIC